MEDRDFQLDDDSLLMRVRAQVMTREDGGWVPLGGGGFSVIGIYKKTGEDNKKVEYMIVGTTTENSMRVLECQLRKDVEYNKVDPTFRHWRTPDDEKFGLTFRSPSDARAFDRGFKRAIEELIEGSSTDSSSLNQLPDNEYEEDSTQLSQVIEPLLPEPHEYQNIQGLPPPRESCGKLRDILTQPPNPNVIPGFGQNSNQHLHRVHYVSRSKSVQNRPTERKPPQTKKYSYSHDSPLWVKSHAEWHSQKDLSLGENLKDPYVKIVKKPPSFHEYSYPSFRGFEEDSKKANHVKVVTSQPPPSPPNKPPFPHKYQKEQTVYSNTKRCTACQEYFNPEKNRRGACRDGTDEMNSCIEKVSCICCANGMIYHCCLSDLDEPQVLDHACSCDMSNTSCYQLCQRWLGLGLLSLFVPCLWCYLPLKCCHWCGVQCGCCGARHEAV